LGKDNSCFYARSFTKSGYLDFRRGNGKYRYRDGAVAGGNFEKLPVNTTRVIIAHRLNTIENADEDILCEWGRSDSGWRHETCCGYAFAREEAKLK